MKLFIKRPGLLVGLLLGITSIYAMFRYFGISWQQMQGLILSSVVLLVGMFLVALILVLALKLAGKLLKILTKNSQPKAENEDNNKE